MIQYLPKKLQYAAGYGVSMMSRVSAMLTSHVTITTVSFILNVAFLVSILLMVKG